MCLWGRVYVHKYIHSFCFPLVGTQNRQQPPVPLICAQKATISRKRNKKKKLPQKTFEPITVNKKSSTVENEKKLSTNSEKSSLHTAEPALKPETPISGFGIILESPSSDVSWYLRCIKYHLY